ncbi:MAG: hypothetical protein IJZ94_06140 [Clostridia bacterium]|nr:hypothetical protein [Clostridia bacterium]
MKLKKHHNVAFLNKLHKISSRKTKHSLRTLITAVLITVQLLLTMLSAYPCEVSAEGTVPENVASDSIESGTQEDETESYTFYDSKKNDFVLNGNVLYASFRVSDNGVEITSIRNTVSDYEWISGASFSELVEVYYDSNSVMHNFDWKYFGCYESETSGKLIFVFDSADGNYSCRQEWYISRTDADGAVISMSYYVITENTAEIFLPERFSSVSLQMSSEEDYYLQYLDGNIKDEKVSCEDVIRFTAGNDDGFDMSIPLYYYNAKGAHGVALGTGVFSPEYSSLIDVAASNDCMIAVTQSEHKIISEETSITYAFPAFFCSVFEGNNSVGKNFIRSWSASEKVDGFASLPLTYENVVGTIELESIQEVRDAFYNMQFFFSVSDIRNNLYSNIKDDLSACPADDVNAYNYILRSAMFCDFDYTKVGLTDGTALKKSAAEHDDLYRNKLASIMLNGRQFPVFHEYNDEGWDGIGFYDSLNKKGAVFVFRNTTESAAEKLVSIQDVEPSLEYKITSYDGSVLIERITGDDLLNNGLTVSMENGAMSDILFIEVAEVDFADVKILLFGNELSSLEIIAVAVILIFVIGVIIAAIIVSARDEYTEK